MASMAYFLSLKDLHFQLSLARQKIMYENKINYPSFAFQIIIYKQ